MCMHMACFYRLRQFEQCICHELRTREAKVGTELRGLFGKAARKGPIPHSNPAQVVRAY